MVRVNIADNREDGTVASACFKGSGKTVVVLVNNGDEQSLKLTGVEGKSKAYITCEGKNCEETQDIVSGRTVTLPAQSVATIVYTR
jgi:hypothetical protein